MTAEAVENRLGGDKPPWCGMCDKRTRLIERDGIPRRCRCHPKTAPLAQFRTCTVCQDHIYEWQMRIHMSDIHGITEVNS
jgi:hypothetical protein